MDGSGKLFLPRPLNSRSWEDGENGLKRSRDNSTEDVDDSTLFHTFLSTSPDDGDNHAYSSPLRSPATISSDQDDRAGPERDARTPPRALSNNSLFGEDFVNSSRRSGPNGRGAFDMEDTDHILTLSPEQQPRLPFHDLSPSETMTPPSASHSQTLSPPPLIQHLENVSYSSRTTSQINHSNNNNNNSHRPPRAPGQIARFSSHSVEGTVTSAFAAHLSKPPVVLPRHHRRASSAGDASFLSALTDASFEAPNGNDLLLPRGDFTKQQHQEDRRLGHRRNASWDPTVESQLHGEVRGMNIDVPVALQQPILSDFSLQMDQARIPDKSAAMNPVVKKSLMTLVKRSPTVSLAPLDHSNASIAALDNLTAQSSTPSETSSLPATRKALDYEEDHFRAKEIDAKVEKLIFDTHEGHIQRLTMFDSNQAKNPKVLREDALLRASSAFEAFQKIISPDDEADHFEVETGHELRLNESSMDMLVRHARIMKSILVLAYPTGGASAAIASGKTSRLQRGKEEESNDTDQDTQDQQESDQGNSSVAQDETGHRINHLSIKDSVGLSNEFVRNAKAVEDQWAMFESLCNGEKDFFKRTTLNLVFYAILPSTMIACFLFYGAGNPQAGWWQPGEPAVDPKGDLNGTTVTSASWWCLFLGVRQIVLYALATCFDVLLVKYLALASPGFIRSLGPNLALLISQGHGYPIKLVSFATLSCLLSYGKSDFKNHWLFWQTKIEVLSQANPAGDVSSHAFYGRVLYALLFVGVSTWLKRLWVGEHFGRRLYSRYNHQLTKIMNRMLLISEVAYLSSTAESFARSDISVNPLIADHFFVNRSSSDERTCGRIKVDRNVDKYSQNLQLPTLFENSEEYAAQSNDENINVTSLKDILLFHHSYQMIQSEYPFSAVFGPSATQAQCSNSAEIVYRRLLKLQDREEAAGLEFGVLSKIVLREKGDIARNRLRALLEVFHPDSNGHIELTGFIQSINETYGDIRVLTRSITNAAQIEKAYENIINVPFFTILLLISLAICGIDVTSSFSGLCGTVVLTAIMVGSAGSHFFEGIFFILIRWPFDIGDHITVSNDDRMDVHGAEGWIVEKMDLFTTTLRMISSRKVATFSNASLARSCIVNLKRSENAQINILLKFDSEISLSKVKVFTKAVNRFVEKHSKEWLAVTSFRKIRVEADLGFVEYQLGLLHRKAWQDTLAIAESRASVSGFCGALQKKLGIALATTSVPKVYACCRQ